MAEIKYDEINEKAYEDAEKHKPGSDTTVVELPNSYDRDIVEAVNVLCDSLCAEDVDPGKTAEDAPEYLGRLLSGPSMTLVEKSITENGVYDPHDDDADGYSSVDVEVSGGGGFSYGAPVQVFWFNGNAIEYYDYDQFWFSSLCIGNFVPGGDPNPYDIRIDRSEGGVDSVWNLVFPSGCTISNIATLEVDLDNNNTFIAIVNDTDYPADWGELTDRTPVTITTDYMGEHPGYYNIETPAIPAVPDGKRAVLIVGIYVDPS